METAVKQVSAAIEAIDNSLPDGTPGKDAKIQILEKMKVQLEAYIDNDDFSEKALKYARDASVEANRLLIQAQMQRGMPTVISPYPNVGGRKQNR
jgi:hypothetical protein